MARRADEGPTGEEHVLPDVEDDLDEESYQRLTGKRRARLVRQRIAFAVVVVVVLAVGGGAYLVWSDRWHPRGAARPSVAASPTCTPAAAPALLAPKDVTVDVLNGTSRKGLAGAVAAELRTRGFVVTRVANAPQATGPATAVVTYPAASVQQAVTVAARFPEAQLVQDDAAKGISVSLGDGYQQLLAEQALVAPVPTGQPGAC
ncbi:LytR C-terminal domain-containing protein [Kineococcus rhizosphaerae]|uniref:LytR cell envelope-related transcriptional attenuator n=1 Tax=Kineococcus rhizosphaerae TaxID=559628 RepID=A0A2T0R5P9_9ACTN|nr:LytR C-terminal domain-containing protein [Kineococcus rhizosphaerae]PRY16098.1 LytR cell envelope-related transcriptional attenuator [Kineococcus rhizosphaerae]